MERMKMLSAVLVATLATGNAACTSDPASSCAEPQGIWEQEIVTVAGDCGFPDVGIRLVDASEPDTPDDPECTGRATEAADMCSEDSNQRCPRRDDNGVITGWLEAVGSISMVTATRWEGTVQYKIDDASGNRVASCVVDITITKI